MSKFPRPPRRLDWIYQREPLYFVTCCTYRRHAFLANKQIHADFIAFAARAQEEHGVAVGRYVILPDHLHFFVAGPHDFILAKWVGALRRVLAKSIDRPNSQDPIWQRGFFDHILRSTESYSQKWDYVRENPVRAGLVKIPEEWPFAGEIVTIDRVARRATSTST